MWQAVRWSQAKLIRRACSGRCCQVAVLSRPRSVLTSAGRGPTRRPRRLGMIVVADRGGSHRVGLFTDPGRRRRGRRRSGAGDHDPGRRRAGDRRVLRTRRRASARPASSTSPVRSRPTPSVTSSCRRRRRPTGSPSTRPRSTRPCSPSVQNTAGVASELKIPQAQVDDFVRDLAVLQALLKAAPDGGTEVDNPSVVVDYVTRRQPGPGRPAAGEVPPRPGRDGRCDQVRPDRPVDRLLDRGQRCRGEPGEEPRAGLVRHLPGPEGRHPAHPVLRRAGAGGAGDRGDQRTGRRSPPRPCRQTPGPTPSTSCRCCSSRTPQQEGVTVNPRYGLWDPRSLQVVPNDFGV